MTALAAVSRILNLIEREGPSRELLERLYAALDRLPEELRDGHGLPGRLLPNGCI